MGRLIVFEGIDGSGKSTQLKKCTDRLKREGKRFRRLSFPQYSEPSSALIKMYLGGEFGDDPDMVNPYAASTFFAVDRFASYAKDWREYYENGGLLITDRYTTSNAIHQGAKLSGEDRISFFKWLYQLEFELMGLPRPDYVIYLDIPAEISRANMRKRELDTGTQGDIHERDGVYLEKCVQCAREAAQLYGWNKISCVPNDREREIDDIHDEIYNMLIKEMWV